MTKDNSMKEQLLFRLTAILDNLPLDIWFRDINGVNLYVNKAFADKLNMKPEDVQGKADDELFIKEEADQYKKTDMEALQTGKATHNEFLLPNKEFRKEYKKVVYDDNGQVAGVIGYAEDITRAVKTKKALKQSELRFRTIFEEAPLGIGIFDAVTGKAYQVNQRYVDATGRTKQEVLDLPWQEYTYAEDVAKNAEMNRRVNAGEITGYSMEKRFVHPNGKLVWVNITVTNYKYEKSAKRVLCMVEDITAKKRAEEEVTYLSYYDHLTGIYNRRYYSEVLPLMDKEENLPISIIMSDVNGLKLTNDAFGHQAGDELLIRTARIMKSICREGDIIARTGGDEFVIILPNTTGESAEHIVRSIQEKTYADGGEDLNVIHSVSFGWATKERSDRDIMQVYKQAEDEMYRHKLVESTRMRRETIRLITKRMQHNDGFELKHSQMVKNYAVELAKAAGMFGTELMELKTAAFLHDIGKVGIDESIMNKADALSEEEWNLIVKHPETGYQILRASNEFNQLAEFVLNHHERMDGKGYPSGIVGNKIPLQSRIISIAEAYAIMITDTPYRKAKSKTEAVGELRRNAGTQFDADLVKLFIEKILTQRGENCEEDKY